MYMERFNPFFQFIEFKTIIYLYYFNSYLVRYNDVRLKTVSIKEFYSVWPLNFYKYKQKRYEDVEDDFYLISTKFI